MKKLALMLTLAALSSSYMMQAQENKVAAPKGKGQIVVPKGKIYVKLNAKGKEIARFTAGQTMAADKEADCAVIPCPSTFPKGVTCWHCKERPEPTAPPKAEAK